MRSTNLLITSLRSQRTRQKVLGKELRTLDVLFLALIIKHISFLSISCTKGVAGKPYVYQAENVQHGLSPLTVSECMLKIMVWNRRDSECHEAVAAPPGSEPWRWRRGNRCGYMSFLIGTRQYFTICLVANPTEIRSNWKCRYFKNIISLWLIL